MPLPDTSNSDRQAVRLGFDNTYARLPERFYARVSPTPVATPRLVKLNLELARSLQLDPHALASEQGVQILAGNRVAEGSEPLALAYAGHQFGYFVPQLGDGRANLLGEVIGPDGVRYDIQLKGSGPTPFSRRGDGRAALGPVLREYIVSEAMATLGVPTTRALAAVTTGEQVFRETILPGAVLTRVAASHLRVGTFQYFAAQGDTEGIRNLADYAIARHYPEAAGKKRPYRALLDGVIARQAHLVAQWMLFGFIHGVMNTDNTSISGETIDYGPCAFMEAYEPDKVFSSIDHQGRYVYSNQPRAALWNLTRLAETLLPILELEEGSESTAIASANEALATNGADFTLTFRRLCDAVTGSQGDEEVRNQFADAGAYDLWASEWHRRLDEEPVSAEARATAMRLANPAYIPRNHVVEAALDAAVERRDFQPFEDLLKILSHPYDERPGLERYVTPASPEECVRQTFCGT
jgi:serine/tyrosine/threonine adenylyltransferase